MRFRWGAASWRRGMLGVMASLWCHSVGGQPANEPLEKFLVTDGTVYAMAKSGSTLFFGGLFTRVGVRSGSGIPVSATTGQPEAVSPMINGTVVVAIGDGQDGWFVGGTFTVVGGFLRTNIVRIRSDRQVDADWAPIVTGGGVSTLVLDGNNLYVGGSFTNVNGQPRNRLAVLDSHTGNLGSWNPNAGDSVLRLVIVDTNVYAGGDFTTMGGQTRGRLAVVHKTSGQVGNWNPNANDSVQAMTVCGGHLYIGGYFTTVGGQSRARLASFDLNSGALDAWNPGLGTGAIVSPSVFTMDSYQNLIFVGGQFTTTGGSNRVNIAAIDATTGFATSWDARQPFITSSGFPTDYVQSLAVYSNAVYVGGPLISIGGQPRLAAAALDLTTGDALPWDPNPNLSPLTFSKSGDAIYMGGLFSALGGVTRTNLAAFDLESNQVTPWNPNLATRSGVPVNAIAVANNQVFVGGFFTTVGDVTRTNLAAIDQTTGSVLNWKPDPNALIYSLATWNDRLYVGGAFSSFDGNARTNFAEVDIATMTVTGWDPAIRSFVRALAVDGDTLYAGGLFSTVSGQSRRRIAAFDLPTQALTAWNPGITNGSYVSSIATAAGRVLIGGSFNVISGFNRTNFAALDAATAQVLPVVANADSFVYGVAATSNLVFIAGNFLNIAGQSRRYLAAVDLNANALANWSPNADFYVNSVQVFDNVLYPMGVFLRVGGQTSRSVAAYPLSLVGTPTVVSNSMRRTVTGNVEFRFTAVGMPQATIQISTNLLNWQSHQTVPLVAGHGLFTESANAPARFYRLSVP